MMKKDGCVPGFISKLWTLVNNPGINDVICWSLDGSNFRISDEQRFTKEILPKFFKHSNLSSFVRQLNMYGFRKVVNIEGGLVKPKNMSVLEFHHLYFQKGNEDLLDYIKRKVSSVRTEDTKISQGDMCKVLEDVQHVRGKQEDMDQKLETMKRENKILWKEVASLRKKHSLQQRTLRKVIQFFASLMQGNCVMGIKKKRPLMIDMSEGPSEKIARTCVLPTEKEPFDVSNPGSVTLDPGVITIMDITNGPGEATTTPCRSVPDCSTNIAQTLTPVEDQAQILSTEQKYSGSAEGSANLGSEVLDCFLPDDGTMVAPYPSEMAIDRTAIEDHVNGIDSTFEDLQALLLGRQFSVKPEFIDNLFNPDLSALDMDMPVNNTSDGPMLEWPDSPIQLSQPDSSPEESVVSGVASYTPANILNILDELCSSLGLEKSSREEDTPLTAGVQTPLLASEDQGYPGSPAEDLTQVTEESNS